MTRSGFVLKIATFDFVVIGIHFTRKPKDKENGVMCNTTPF
jgi:hypothetical protein